jgi:hypothetical protein
MKPLILMLLFAIAVEAQSIPEVARRERERQAKATSIRILTTENAKPNAPGGMAATVVNPTAPAAAAPTPTAPAAAPQGTPATPAQPPTASAPSAAAPAKPTAGEEALQRYNEQLSRLRARVIELQDQETTLQIKINDLKNQFLSPVTDTAAREQAQATMEQTQQQLSATQKELADTRRLVQGMEAAGPPKP